MGPSRRHCMSVACLVALAAGCDGSTRATSEPAADTAQADEGAMSSPTRWVHAHPPRDEALLQAPAKVVSGPDALGNVALSFQAKVLRVHVVSGDQVAAGDPIVDVASSEILAAAADFVGTSKQLDVHRKRYKQLKKLREQGLIDGTQLFDLSAEIASLETAQLRARALLDGGGVPLAELGRVLQKGTISLTAPIAGTVTHVEAHTGEVRSASGEALAVIVGAGATRVEARFLQPPPDGATFVFETALGQRHAVEQRGARVVDAEDGSIVMWFSLAEDDRLPGGTRGVVHLQLDARTFEVPASAVVRGEKGDHLVVRTPDGHRKVAVEVVVVSGASALVKGAELTAELDVADHPERLQPKDR